MLFLIGYVDTFLDIFNHISYLSYYHLSIIIILLLVSYFICDLIDLSFRLFFHSFFHLLIHSFILFFLSFILSFCFSFLLSSFFLSFFPSFFLSFFLYLSCHLSIVFTDVGPYLDPTEAVWSKKPLAFFGNVGPLPFKQLHDHLPPAAVRV